MRLKFVFCCERMKAIQTKKITMMFISLNNVDSFLTGSQCYFSPFEIIKIITCFLRFQLCFETLTGYIYIFFSI